MLKEKSVLITGGTGSIGNYIVPKICALNPRKVIVFSRDEEKQYNMKQRITTSQIEYITGDIRDYNRLGSAFYDVDYVIHTAAMKQVPIAENNPVEAVLTNVIGTENVLRCAIQQNVQKVICLSSDKAISPANCMGMTKGICERLVRSSNPNLFTSICCVRLGNVLGSRGSVLPTWKNQISQTHTITLTSEEMTRFVMSFEDVYELIMHAIQFGQHGEIVFSKMKSCCILDLAKVVCKYYNLNWKKDIRITGIREGEKLYEEIISEEERNHIYKNNGYYHISDNINQSDIYIPRKSNECLLMTIEELTSLLAENDLF